MPEEKKLYIVDVSSYFYRAFHAIGHLSNSKGLSTNAVYGVATMLLKLIKAQKPDMIAIAFDSPGPTFRDDMFKEYKANRIEMPSDLVSQLPYIKRLVEALNLPSLRFPGVEADDIIASLAAAATEKGIRVVIVTGDKDFSQIVSDKVTLLDTMTNKATGPKEVLEKYLVPPEKMTDLFALIGDAIDNVPGVKGIGPVSAAKLINEFGSLDNLLANSANIKSDSIREKIEAGRESALLSRRLIALKLDVDVQFTPERFALTSPDPDKSRALFTELEMPSLLKELPATAASDSSGYSTFSDEKEFERFIGSAISGESLIAVHCLTTPGNPAAARLIGVAFCEEPGKARYLPLLHRYLGAPRQVEFAKAMAVLKPLLETEAVPKCGHDCKLDMIAFKRQGLPMNGVSMDSMIASYLLNPSKSDHSLDTVAKTIFGCGTVTYESIAGKGKTEVALDTVSVERAMAYACEKADLAFRLAAEFEPALKKEGLWKLFSEMELPLIGVLAEMEACGVGVDTRALNELSESFAKQLSALTKDIHGMAGEVFNIDSPKQMGEVLFANMKLPHGKKTKTGFSTNADVLTELAKEHPIASKIMEYRSLSKLKNTYADALPELVNPATKRIHASFNQAVTATGRLSSSEPNLQNIPVKTEEGKKIRKAFIAEKGHTLVAADYSQIELRVLAHFSQDATLLRAFNKNEDVHTITAQEIFNVAPDEVTSEMRRQAKVINFGILYGMSAHGLATELGLPHPTAQEYIDNYFLKYPGVRSFIDRTLAEARKTGMVRTLYGRMRRVPDLENPNPTLKGFAERIAVNTPIQGTAADMIKLAMIRIASEIGREFPKVRMILQVHDELVFETPDADVKKLSEFIQVRMTDFPEIKCPIKLDISTGRNWAEVE